MKTVAWSLSWIVWAASLVGCQAGGEGRFADLASAQRIAHGSGGPAEPGTASEDNLTEASSLDDYLIYAARHNPGLEAAFDRWKAAREQVPQAKALPDPRLSYRHYVSEVETRVGAMRWGLGLSQTFPWAGKLERRGGAAGELARAQRQRFQAAALELAYQVKKAYYEYYYLWRNIAIVEDWASWRTAWKPFGIFASPSWPSSTRR